MWGDYLDKVHDTGLPRRSCFYSHHNHYIGMVDSSSIWDRNGSGRLIPSNDQSPKAGNNHQLKKCAKVMKTNVRKTIKNCWNLPLKQETRSDIIQRTIHKQIFANFVSFFLRHHKVRNSDCNKISKKYHSKIPEVHTIGALYIIQRKIYEQFFLPKSNFVLTLSDDSSPVFGQHMTIPEWLTHVCDKGHPKPSPHNSALALKVSTTTGWTALPIRQIVSSSTDCVLVWWGATAVPVCRTGTDGRVVVLWIKTAPHVCWHSSAVAKLFPFPWQPPYAKALHVWETGSKDQRGMVPRQGPISAGCRQTDAEKNQT